MSVVFKQLLYILHYLCPFEDHAKLYSFPTRRSSDLYYSSEPVLLNIQQIHNFFSNETGKAAPDCKCANDKCQLYCAYLPFLFQDRKSTRLKSSHLVISYAVLCLKNKI